MEQKHNTSALLVLQANKKYQLTFPSTNVTANSIHVLPINIKGIQPTMWVIVPWEYGKACSRKLGN